MFQILSLTTFHKKEVQLNGFGDFSKVTKLFEVKPRFEPVYCYFHLSELPWSSFQKQLKKRNPGITGQPGHFETREASLQSKTKRSGAPEWHSG